MLEETIHCGHCSSLLGMPRMQDPDPSLSQPFLRVVFAVSNLVSHQTDKEQVCLLLTVKAIIPQVQWSSAVMEIHYVCSIHVGLGRCGNQ